MATPEYESFRKAMLKEIENGLQIESDTHRLEATNVAVDKPINPQDLDSIKKARLKGRSFADKVSADLALIDRATGRVLDKKRVHVADIPVQTPFKTYLVDGAHYQAKNQSQLKGTAYTEMTQAGDVRSQFRTERGSNFQILFDPETEKFRMKVKHSHVGLAPILQTLGVNEDTMQKTWGKSIASKNVVDEDVRQKEINKFAKTVFGNWRIKDKSDKEIDSMVVDHFLKESVLNPEASEKTLGKPFKNVTPEALIAASNKIIGILKGKVEPDKKDEIFFKRMRGLAETSTDFIQNALPGIQRKIQHRLNGERRVSEIVSLDAFRRPIKSVFTTTRLQGAGETTNFVDILSEDGKVTIMGEGGITDTHKVKRSAMDIHLSSLGFIDPVMTSAGTAGMTEHLAMGAVIKNDKIHAPFIDMKTGKTVIITPEDTVGKVVAFPDGPSKDGLNKAVLDGEMVEVTKDKIDYMVPSPKLMFSSITNLIPFIQNDSGSRAIFGTGQYTQAVTLTDREAPLAQTFFMSKNGKKITFEKMIGNQASIISPVGGTVSRVSRKSITVRGGGGSTLTIPLYDNMPLNQSGFLHNNPLVKTGDQVVKGQVLADSNNTKNGVLALGRNLLTAIMPWKGLTYEDGVVISEKAARLLSSEHLRESVGHLDPNSKVNRDTYIAQTRGTRFQISGKNEDKLDKLTGLIKPGEIVEPGDVMATIIRKNVDDPEAKLLGILQRPSAGKWRPDPIKWDKDVDGEVIDVEQTAKNVRITVRTKEPARIGDKLSARHGEKGVVTKIIPDAEMPVRARDGKAIEMIVDPSGIPSRVNVGQVLEMAAGKIAESTGKPYIVDNFAPGVDYTQKLSKELEEHGLPDKEDVYDPESGKTIPNINVGPKFTMKLEHQVTSKFKTRTPGQKYNAERAPTDGRTIDKLTFYGLVAHGASAVLRESAVLKAEANPEAWATYEAGGKLMLPQEAPFTWKKTEAMIKGMGVNVTKRGSRIFLTPLTDKETLDMSNGQVTSVDTVRRKDIRPVKGGIFDAKITGGPTEDGVYWSHITLPEPVPNQIFKKSIKSLTNISEIDIDRISMGQKSIDGMTGPSAIKAKLDAVNVDEMLAKSFEEAKTARGTMRDVLNRRIRSLKALKEYKMTPSEAYMQKYVPVIPPNMRLPRTLQDGTKTYPDINHLYQDLALLSIESYNNAQSDDAKKDVLGDIYNAVGAIAGISEPVSQGIKARGFFKQLTGKKTKRQIREQGSGGQSPKFGYFQRKVMRKGQDLSTGGVIVADPGLGVDEIGIPEDMAWELYKPMILRRLRMRGMTGGEAKKKWEAREEIARKAMLEELGTRPIFWNRAPSWHRYNIMASNPVIRPGKAIRTPNLPINTYFQGDFDGDSVFLHVPVGEDAVQEAKGLMPSRMFMKTGDGSLMLKPQGSAVAGLYQLSKTPEGRGEINKVLPDGWDISNTVTGRDIEKLLTRYGKAEPRKLGRVANKLTQLGDKNATYMGMSIGLSDLKINSTGMDRIADRIEKDVRYYNRLSTAAGKNVVAKRKLEEKKGEVMMAGLDGLDRALRNALTEDNTFGMMLKSGTKGNMTQLRQILGPPLLFHSSTGELVTTPVKTSYAKGLKPSEYFIQQIGGRGGLIKRSIETGEPGDIGKDLLGLNADRLIEEEDCGTRNGIMLSVNARDLTSRRLAEPVVTRSGLIGNRNDLVTSRMLENIRKSKVRNVKVRSPLRCESRIGICQMCYGLDEMGNIPALGTNVGVRDSQAIIDNISHVSLKSWHLTGGKEGNELPFDALKRIMKMQDKIPDQAVLATRSGQIKRVTKNSIGGHDVYIGDQRHRLPDNLGISKRVGVGKRVKIGDMLTERGNIRPQDILAYQGIDKAQDFITDELSRIFDSEKPGKIRRRTLETIASGLTRFGEVEDPGDSNMIPFDIVNINEIKNFNDNVNQKVKIGRALGFSLGKTINPGMRKGALVDKDMIGILRRSGFKDIDIEKASITFTPILKGIDRLAATSGDWISRMNMKYVGQSFLKDAASGAYADIHGFHPIAAYAYGAEFGQGKGIRF